MPDTRSLLRSVKAIAARVFMHNVERSERADQLKADMFRLIYSLNAPINSKRHHGL